MTRRMASLYGAHCNVRIRSQGVDGAVRPSRRTKFRVVQMETGGASEARRVSVHDRGACGASRDEIWPLLKIVYDRMEDMAATTKRLLQERASHRGKQKRARFSEARSSSPSMAALMQRCPRGLSRGTIHAGGPYFWPSVRIRTKAVATNTLPMGRFADLAAAEFVSMEPHGPHRRGRGNSPVEIRRRNFLSRGRRRPRNRPFEKKLIWIFCSPGAGTFPAMPRRKRAFGRETRTDRAKKGIGIAAFLHGADSRAPANAI